MLGEPIGCFGDVEQWLVASVGGPTVVGGGVDDVFGPDDEVDVAVDRLAGFHVPFEHGACLAEIGPCVLGTAALHHCDVDCVDRVDGPAGKVASDRAECERSGDPQGGHPPTLEEIRDADSCEGNEPRKQWRTEQAGAQRPRCADSDHGVGRNRRAAERVIPADQFDEDERADERKPSSPFAICGCRGSDNASQ